MRIWSERQRSVLHHGRRFRTLRRAPLQYIKESYSSIHRAVALRYNICLLTETQCTVITARAIKNPCAKYNAAAPMGVAAFFGYECFLYPLRRFLILIITLILFNIFSQKSVSSPIILNPVIYKPITFFYNLYRLIENSFLS